MLTEALNYAGRTDSVRVRAPAKINLHLGVGDRRDDGYHELTTVYQAISLYDEVIVSTADVDGVTCEVDGAFAAEVPTDSTNLAVAAVELLAAEAGVTPSVNVKVRKRIPVAGGLAGGSADGAAALLAAAHLWELNVDRAELLRHAAKLGSDVPFCLMGNTALGVGHGEQVAPVADNGMYHWVVATADTQLSTPEVYREVDRLRAAGDGRYSDDVTELSAALRDGNVRTLAAALRNDMSQAALSLRPQLREVLTAGMADGALAALVSGSGPTTLFLTRDEHHANALAGRLRLRQVTAGVLVATGPVQGAHVV